MNVGEKIKIRRKELGLSADQLAEKLGKDRSTIYRYESKEIEKLPIDIIEPLADALLVSPQYLMGWVAKNNEPVDNSISVSAMLPIYGCIPAGVPALAEEYVEGYMPTSVPNPDEYFFLRVQGNSMIGAGIIDGCKVLIHKQNSADDGQIVACRVNGDEATLKRFKHHGSVVLLKPENNAYDDCIVPVEDFENGTAQIIGVVRQIVIDV